MIGPPGWVVELVRRLALFHHDPLRDDAGVDRIVEQARRRALGTGGTVTGVPEAAAAIRSFAENVAPVHSYTDTLCASAGYYLAAACNA